MWRDLSMAAAALPRQWALAAAAAAPAAAAALAAVRGALCDSVEDDFCDSSGDSFSYGSQIRRLRNPAGGFVTFSVK
jgi:hypothetical protein